METASRPAQMYGRKWETWRLKCPLCESRIEVFDNQCRECGLIRSYFEETCEKLESLDRNYNASDYELGYDDGWNEGFEAGKRSLAFAGDKMEIVEYLQSARDVNCLLDAIKMSQPPKPGQLRQMVLIDE